MAILRLTVGDPSLLGTIDNIANGRLFLCGSSVLPEPEHFCCDPPHSGQLCSHKPRGACFALAGVASDTDMCQFESAVGYERLSESGPAVSGLPL